MCAATTVAVRARQEWAYRYTNQGGSKRAGVHAAMAAAARTRAGICMATAMAGDGSNNKGSRRCDSGGSGIAVAVTMVAAVQQQQQCPLPLPLLFYSIFFYLASMSGYEQQQPSCPHP